MPYTMANFTTIAISGKSRGNLFLAYLIPGLCTGRILLIIATIIIIYIFIFNHSVLCYPFM